MTALEGVPKMFCFSKNFGEGEEPAGPVEKARREEPAGPVEKSRREVSSRESIKRFYGIIRYVNMVR